MSIPWSFLCFFFFFKRLTIKSIHIYHHASPCLLFSPPLIYTYLCMTKVPDICVIASKPVKHVSLQVLKCTCVLKSIYFVCRHRIGLQYMLSTKTRFLHVPIPLLMTDMCIITLFRVPRHNR